MRDYAGGYGTGYNVKRKRYGHSLDVVFPVFLPYLASDVLKEKYHLEVLDAQAERLNQEEVLTKIEKEKPTFLVSYLSLPSLDGDVFLLNKIKEKFPRISLVGIGTVCKALPEEILRKSKVDFLIRNEYPFYGSVLTKLIEADEAKNVPGISYLSKNEIINTPLPSLEKESLNNLNFSAYRFLPLQKYKLYFNDLSGRNWNYLPIFTSKGCPFPCLYCPYPIGFGKKIQNKSPEKLIQELEYLKKNFNFNAFLFRDQVFTFNPERAEKIANALIEKNLDINWLFETRVDKISKNLLKKMKEAGCNRIHYGVESGDENLLKTVGKPGLTKEAIKKVFKYTTEQGILTLAHIILGLPGENKKTLTNTYDFISELKPDQVSWNLVTPYPKTKLFARAKEKNLILSDDWSDYTSNNPVMRTEALSAEELVEARKKFTRKFELRNFLDILRKSFYQRRKAQFLLRRSLHHFPLLLRKLFI